MNINRILRQVLQSDPDSQIIVDEETMFLELQKKLTHPEEPLQSFSLYLEEEVYLKGTLIFKLIEKLIGSFIQNNCKIELPPKRLESIYLLWKLFQSIDMLKSGNEKNRKKAFNVLQNFKFEGRSLLELLKNIMSQIQSEYLSMADDVQKMVLQKWANEINSLFVQQITQSYSADKTIQQQLKDLMFDYYMLPQNSVQKLLQKQLIVAFYRKYPEKEYEQDWRKWQSFWPSFIFKNQIHEIQNLQQKYKSTNGQFDSAQNEIFQKLRIESDPLFYQNLCCLKRKINIINILQLNRLVDKTYDSKSKIQNKHVILFMGNTGSGKSTNLLKFLGYTLKKVYFKGLQTLRPDEKIEKDHESFHTSPQAKSCTRYINAVKVPDVMYKKGTKQSDRIMTYCDSPGFGDSAGVEVDIANNIGIISALYGAKSVRLVIIIGYEDLVANRCEGAITMGNTISNLFHSISQVSESIKIFFNKVPSEKIKMIPILIQSRMDNQTQVQKTNQKLKAFLEILLEQSNQLQNYIDPLKSDYKQLFKKIIKCDPIQKIKQNFRYDFTDATKKQISSFSSITKTKIKDFYHKGHYIQAKYHLQMMLKLKSILSHDDNHFNQITKFIQNESIKKFTEFEQLVNQIVQGEITNRNIDKLKELKQKILDIHNNFSRIQNINTKSSEDLTSLVAENEKKLFSKFDKFQQLTNIEKLAQAVKSFSKYLSNQIQEKIKKQIQRKLNCEIEQLKSQMRCFEFQNMKIRLERILIVNKLLYLISLNKQNNLNQIQSTLKQMIENNFNIIRRNILDTKNPLALKYVEESLKCLKHNTQILKLQFFQKSEDYKKAMGQIQKKIMQKCQQNLRSLENFNQSFISNDKDRQINSIHQDLRNKKNDIQLLMKFPNVEESLKSFYDETKQSFGRKLKQSGQVLNNAIDTLKKQKDDEIQRNIDIIKKASQTILKCSDLMGNAQNLKQLTQQITSQFINYLKIEIQKIKNIEIRLGQISPESLLKIQRQYKKNQTYEKMGSINPSIKDEVQTLKKQFNKILTNPFIQFTEGQLAYLQGKPYKALSFCIQKFEKLSYYSLQIRQIITASDYKESFQNIQKNILLKLKKLVNDMQTQLTLFMEFELNFQKLQIPQYTKDLFKILTQFYKKKSASIYLSQKLDFQIEDIVSNVFIKMEQIKSSIHTKFEDKKQTSNDHQLLQLLSKNCSFYSAVQQIFKFEQNKKFNFKQLEKEINLHLKSILKDNQQKAIHFISSDRINWDELRQIYNQFLVNKNLENNRQRGVIIRKIREVQRKILVQLKQSERQLNQNPQSMDNKKAISDFVQHFKKANQMRVELTKMYCDQDKKQIQITNQSLKKIGSNLIQFFTTQFQQVNKNLSNSNINLKKRINTFGNLQNIVYNVFIQKDVSETPQKNQQNEINLKNLKIFIDQKTKDLKEQIQNHQYVNQFQKNSTIENKNVKLKNLLLILQKAISAELQNKYQKSNNFMIDSGFKNYFYNFSNPQDQKVKQIKQNLQNNIMYHFDKQIQELKQSYNTTIEDYNKKQKIITQKISFLPTQLVKTYTEKFNRTKSQLIKNDQGFVLDLIKQVSNNPINIDRYYQESLKAKNNGKKIVHRRLIDELMKHYNTINFNKGQRIQQRIKYLRQFYIDIYNRKQRTIKDDTQMFNQLSKNFKQELNKISNIFNSNLTSLVSFIQKPIVLQKDSKIELNLIDSFQIYSFVKLQIKDQLFINNTQFKQNIDRVFNEKFLKIQQTYYKKALQKPKQNLALIDILQDKALKKLQTQFSYLKNAGKMIGAVKKQFQHLQSNFNDNIDNNLIQKIMKLQDFEENNQTYINQIKNLVTSIQQYQLYSDIKRNFNHKELSQNLNSIDVTLQILNERKKFFFQMILKDNQYKYDIQKLIKHTENESQKLIKQSQDQIKDTFNTSNSEQPVKTNMLISIIKITKQQKFKILFKGQIQKQFIRIENLIKQQQTKLSQKTKIAMKNTAEKTKVQFQQIKTIKEKTQQQITSLKQNTAQQIRQTQKKLTEQFQEKKKNQPKQEKKKEYQNAKNNQINSMKNVKNQEKDKKIIQIQNKNIKIIQKHQTIIDKQVKLLAQILILYQKVIIDINYDNEKHKNNFQSIINQSKENSQLLKQVQSKLSNSQNDARQIGKHILTTKKVFSNYVNHLHKQKTKAQDINYVIKYLKKITLNGKQPLVADNLSNIQKKFYIWEKKYNYYKKLYQQNPMQSVLNNIVTECKDLGKSLQGKSQRYAQQKLHLLAGIFAIWAIIKSQICQDQVQFTIEPHPTQITTLILLLGLAHDNVSIKNRMAQLGTGQGKSIVLAGLSCFLALIGYNVRCACYSSYLSQRDQQSFKCLFEKLNVQNKVKYGTFNQLCQNILNGDGGNLKDSVQKMINAEPSSWKQKFTNIVGINTVKINIGPNEIKQNPTMLIIDQVDVFFDENYFGNNYCPGITLKDLTVNTLLQYVFEEVSKGGEQLFKKIKNSDQFKNLVKRYPNLQKLLQNQIHGMIAGAQAYKHEYFLIEKKLVYKDNDSISPNISYGYKTVFANLYEHRRGNVSKSNLEEAMKISLVAAQFSYAMLPKYFVNILGVTGTLEVLPMYKKKQLISRYLIEDQYAIPSAFGQENKRIQNYRIVPTNKYYDQIVKNINEIQDKRPIIIFFNGSRQINEFSVSPQFSPFLKRTANLTEQHEATVRDQRILRAANQNAITLMTNSFGRGTDFIILSDNINNNGGLHVIQVFLTVDEAEQVQIKGRTARQSNNGSYICIIPQNELQQLKLTASDIPPNAEANLIHQILLKKRQERIQKISQSTIKMLKQSDQSHEKTVNIFKKKELSQKDLIQYIQSLNYYPVMQKTIVRTVLGLDGTGSMGFGLKKCCQIINVAFQRTYLILQQKNVKATIEVKIMIYRNYNSPSEDILQTTAFQNTSTNLKRFLDRVGPKGGAGNQAIEVFFQALNKQQNTDQVIIIGDAAPNTDPQVGQKRSGRGENYWNTKGFPITTFNAQFQRFITKKCPVNAFYLAQAQAFKNMADRTNGKSQYFDVNSKNASDQLTGFLVTNILRLIQEKSGSNVDLVNTYIQKFPKVYT